MPALGSRAADARTRSLRLFGLALALLFMGSLGATYASPVEAKDWTPQIQTTRRAQIYWESVMRSADAELRSLKKSQKQAQRKLKKVKANLKRANDKRAATKRSLKEARKELSSARADLKASALPDLPPDAAAALLAVATRSSLVPFEAVAEPAIEPLTGATSAADEPTTAEDDSEVDERSVAKIERSVKKAKRNFKKAQRKARRSARNTRSAKARLVSLKAAERSATGRRESAERSLGAWILAMAKYGRIRATKKSDARPGVNSSFAWPVHGRISQYYHRGHDGLDIVRYQGAPVRSMAFGVVTYVGWNPWDQHGRAFMVVVTHAGGYETLYGHLLPRRSVRVGQEVKKGEVIGYMGSTGNSTGPHLHLELRRGRTTINPIGFL